MKNAIGLLSIVLLGLVSSGSADDVFNSRYLWSDAAAPKWDLCYPVGNGTMGAMNLGTFPKDTLFLNHDCMWSHPEQKHVAAGSRKEGMDRSFDLFMKGDIAGGQRAYGKAKSGSSGKGVYQCLGKLAITHAAGENAGVSIKRSLNLLTGESITDTKTPRGAITQTILADYPDQCIVVRLETTEPKGLDCCLELSRAAGITRKFAAGYDMGFDGSTGAGGVRFMLRIRVLPDSSGTVVARGNDLVINGCKAVTVVMTSATDHNRADPLVPRIDNWSVGADKRLDKACGMGWNKLRERAVADHEGLMERCVLDVGSTDPAVLAMPMAKRMARVRKGGYDPDLLETFFQFGRHMLIGSSRPGSLPPNLQGLWGVGLRAAWSGDFHLNINVQMNMWPANLTGLSECNEPFFALLKLLHKYGADTASSVGCRGYAAGLAGDGWGFSDFVGGNLEWDSTIMGGHWAQEHLMEYYRFTQDRSFLLDTAWPILKDGSLFMLDWMRENPENGMLISGPGGSPENKYRYSGDDGKQRSAYINIGNTFAHAVAWETFSDTLECAEILGVNDKFVAEVRAALKRVPPPAVGEDGRIMEWRKPFGEVWKGHRHKSHLYGLYPGHQISVAAEPELAKAAEQSLKVRMDRKNGDTGGGGRTGWNLAWSANLWARLQRGNEALAVIEEQIARQVNDNLFNRCGRPYQIDGNLGSPAAMAEMLMQSHEKTKDGVPLIRLLPALPSKWSSGSVKGLCARGGFVVDIKWSNGRFESGKISSLQGGRAVVMIENRRINVLLKKGESLVLR